MKKLLFAVFLTAMVLNLNAQTITSWTVVGAEEIQGASWEPTATANDMTQSLTGTAALRTMTFYGTINDMIIQPDLLYFVALNDDDTVRLNKYASNNLDKLTATFEYSKNKKTWTEYATWATSADPENIYQGSPIALSKGDTVFFRAKGSNGKNATMSDAITTYFLFAFGVDDSIAAGGNVMSLYDASCEQDTMTKGGFVNLFNNARQLVRIPKLQATKLADNCYYGMFQNCFRLEVDTCLNDAQSQFEGALLVVPNSATASNDWNQQMFAGCKGAAKYTAPYGIQPGGHYSIKKANITPRVVVTSAKGPSAQNAYDLGTDSICQNSTAAAQGGVLKVEANAFAKGTNLTFKSNSTTSNKSGGAVFSIGTLHFAGNTVFTENASSSSSGGAIAAESSSTVNFSGQAVFTGNTASNSGGAIHNYHSTSTITFSDSATFKNNQAKKNGGAINNNQGIITFEKQATFTGNKSTDNTTSYGGAVRNSEGTITFNEGAVFDGNTVIVSGGAVYNDQGTITFAGLMDLKTNSDTWVNTGVSGKSAQVRWDLTGGLEQYGSIKNFQYYKNFGEYVNQLLTVNATQEFGEYVIATGDTAGYAADVLTGKYKFYVTIDGATLSDALKANDDVVTFENNDYLLSICDTNLVLSIAKAGTLKGGRTVVTSTMGTEASPYDLGTGLTYLNNTFTTSKAEPGGAAVNVEENAFVTGNNLTFKNNKAVGEGMGKTNGGAVYSKGTLQFNGMTVFTDNMTSGSGGAIYSNKSMVNFGGQSFFTNNSADDLGGAIDIYGGIYTFSDTAIFKNNQSKNYGGAIRNNGSLTFEKKANFIGNKATGTNVGGAIFNNGKISFKVGAIFDGNTASNANNGGAIFNTAGNITFADTMDLKTQSDTWVNEGQCFSPQLIPYANVKWDLTGGLAQYGSIKNFQRYSNQPTQVNTDQEYLVNQILSVKTAGQELGEYVIATGDMTGYATDTTKKYNFFITDGVNDTVPIKVGDIRKDYNKYKYSLAISDNGTPSDATDDKLVLTVEKVAVKIGDTEYENLAAALADVQEGDTITLTQENNDNVPLNIPNSKFFINLAGNNYKTSNTVTVNDSLVVIDSVEGSQAKFTADSLAVTDKARVSGPVVSMKTSLTQNADLTKGTNLTTGNTLRIMDFKLTGGAQLTTNGGSSSVNAVEVLQDGKLLLSGANTLLKATKFSGMNNYGTTDVKDGATLSLSGTLYNRNLMNVKGSTLNGRSIFNDSIMNFEGDNTINATDDFINRKGVMTFKKGNNSVTSLRNSAKATLNIQSDAKVSMFGLFTNSGKAIISGELLAQPIVNSDSLIVDGGTLKTNNGAITNNQFMELTKATLNAGSKAITNNGVMNLKADTIKIATSNADGLVNAASGVLNIEKDATLSFTNQMTFTNQGTVNLKGGRILSGNAGETGIINSATLNLESGAIDCPVVNKTGASIIWKLGQDSIDLKYDKLSNSGKLVINIDSIQKSLLNTGIKKVIYPIASGDFSDLTGKDTFIFVGDGIDSTKIKVNGDTVMCGDRNFALAVRNDSLVFILCPDNMVLDEMTVTVDSLKAIKGKKGNVRIKRAFIRDGEYNTICLPFSLSAAQLAQSPLASYTKLLEFTSAKVKNYGKSDETLVINMSETDAIQAGHPYIIEWDSIGDTIANPVFRNVTVTTEYATNKAQLDGAIMFFGTFTPFMVYENDMDFIFIDEKSQLSWPNKTNLFKAFRAYFQINKANPAGLRSGMNAIFGSDDEEGTTRVLNLNSNDDASKARKLMLEGRVVIERDGRYFDMTGKEIR